MEEFLKSPQMTFRRGLHSPSPSVVIVPRNTDYSIPELNWKRLTSEDKLKVAISEIVSLVGSARPDCCIVEGIYGDVTWFLKVAQCPCQGGEVEFRVALYPERAAANLRPQGVQVATQPFLGPVEAWRVKYQ